MASLKALENKKQQVQKINEKIVNAGSFVLADYRGLTVEQDTKIRTEMRKAGVEYKVVKNNVLKFAIKGTNYEDLLKFLDGPTAIAISSDQVAPAKILTKFAKDYKAFDIKAGGVEGKVIDVKGVEMLSELPSKEELIAKMMGSLNSPITGLVNVLNGNIRGLAVVLNAIVEKMENQSA